VRRNATKTLQIHCNWGQRKIIDQNRSSIYLREKECNKDTATGHSEREILRQTSGLRQRAQNWEPEFSGISDVGTCRIAGRASLHVDIDIHNTRSSFSPALGGKYHKVSQIRLFFPRAVYIRDATWTNSPRHDFFLLSLVNKQTYALTTQQPSFLPPLPLNNLYSNLSNKHTPLNPLNYLSTTPKPLFPPPPGVQENPTTLNLFAQYKVQQSFPLHPIHLHKTSDVVSYCQ